MRIPFFVWVAVLTPLLWVSGCATQADIQTEKQARETLQAQLANNKASVEDVRREIQKVRGEIEEVRYRLDRVARERVGSGPQVKILEDRIAALERQFQTREGEIPSAGPAVGNSEPKPTEPQVGFVPNEPPLPTPSRPNPMASPSTSSGSEGDLALRETPEAQDEYRLGLRALQDKQYEKAVQQFRAFQRKYPTSDMADDAQYWIGESYFMQKDYNRAILEFNDVLKYRRGDKVPAALLRQAQAFVEIGDKTDARLILQKLVNDYPNSEQTREAKEKLQSLGR